jgi:hypothetical protein
MQVSKPSPLYPVGNRRPRAYFDPFGQRAACERLTCGRLGESERPRCVPWRSSLNHGYGSRLPGVHESVRSPATASRPTPAILRQFGQPALRLGTIGNTRENRDRRFARPRNSPYACSMLVPLSWPQSSALLQQPTEGELGGCLGQPATSALRPDGDVRGKPASRRCSQYPRDLPNDPYRTATIAQIHGV